MIQSLGNLNSPSTDHDLTSVYNALGGAARRYRSKAEVQSETERIKYQYDELSKTIANIQNFEDQNEITDNMNLEERLISQDRALMEDKDNLNRYLKENMANTLFILKHFPLTEVWAPKPFRLTGRLPIA